MADIVIVEDNDVLARAYALGLEQQGHLVRLAGDEDQLHEALELHLPDLVLLDIGLPGVDGLEVLRVLRSDPRTAGLRVAVLSNFSDRRMVHRALELDVLDFVEKAAMTPTILADQVRRWLERPA